VDYSQWNPASDPHLPAHYSKRIYRESESASRRYSLSSASMWRLPRHRPLIGMVTRLVARRGRDLIAEIGEDLANEEVTLVALGIGRQEL